MKMRMTALLAALAWGLSPAGAWGVAPSWTWAEIAAVDGVYGVFPNVWWDGVFYGVDGLCRDGDGLLTTRNRPRCRRWEYGELEDRCLEWSRDPVRIPIASVGQRCARWHQRGFAEDPACERWEAFERVIPLSYEVAVLRDDGDGRGGTRLFWKDFTIPDCPRGP